MAWSLTFSPAFAYPHAHSTVQCHQHIHKGLGIPKYIRYIIYINNKHYWTNSRTLGDTCVDEALRQLTDEYTCQKLTQDPRVQYNETITQKIDQMNENHEINPNMAKAPKNEKPRTPLMFFLLKIHKNPNTPSRQTNLFSHIRPHRKNVSPGRPFPKPNGKGNRLLHRRCKGFSM